MTKKRVTLFVNSEIYDRFKDYCDRYGLVISKQFENYIEKEIKKEVVK